MTVSRFRRPGLWLAPLLAIAIVACDDQPVDSAEVEAPNGQPATIPIERGYLSSRYAESQNDWNTAADYTLAVLEEAPDHPDILRRAVIFLTAAGRVDEAAPLAERLVEIEPTDTVGRIVLVVEHARDGSFDAAAALLDELPAESRSDALIALLRGWTAMGRGDTEAAIAAVEEMGRNRGLGTFLSMHQALMLDLDGGRTQEAEEAYRAVMGDGAQAPLRAGIAFASFLQRQGRSEDAREILALYEADSGESMLLSRAIETVEAGDELPRLVDSAAGGLAEGLFDVGSALAEQRAARTAMLYARLALRLEPDFAAARYLVGSMLHGFERWEAAIDAFEKVPENHPMSWAARLDRSSALDQLGRTDEAVLLLREMVEERPDRWDAATELGDMQRRHERFAEAAEAYEIAVSRVGELDDRHWGLLYVRGIAYERADQWEKAEADFLRALELKPDDPYVLNYLAYSWVEQGKNLDQATEMLRKAVAAEQDDGYIVDSMGWVLYKLGRFEEAVMHLERAAELRPHDATIIDHLGDAYWQVGRKTEARYQWERALVFDPDEDLERAIRAKLEGEASPADVPGAEPKVAPADDGAAGQE